MPIKRGTVVSIYKNYGDHVDGVGGTYWLKGRVCSRTKNGWLRVRVYGNGPPLVIRNSPEYVVKFQDPLFPYSGAPNPKEEIDSISEPEDDDLEVVDPPDDAYAALTCEQQKAVRRLIGEFLKVNKSAAYI